MIIDTSAIVAILRNEPENDSFSELIAAAIIARLSAATMLELGIVIDSYRRPDLSQTLDRFLYESEILVEPFTEIQARIARQAYRDYGKGSKHRANLNFGDCFSYALAIDMNEPSLFKGDDFNHTDVHVATPTSSAS